MFELIGEFITSSEIVEFQTHWKYRDSCFMKYMSKINKKCVYMVKQESVDTWKNWASVCLLKELITYSCKYQLQMNEQITH